MKHLIRNSSRWLKVVPELTFFDDPAERAAAWKLAFKTFRWRYVAATGVIMGLISIFGPRIYNNLMGHLRATFMLPRMRFVTDLALMCVFDALLAFGAIALLIYSFRRRIQRSLRQQLLARGVPICLQCGYDLRGQVEPRCPECGTAFDASLIKPPHVE